MRDVFFKLILCLCLSVSTIFFGGCDPSDDKPEQNEGAITLPKISHKPISTMPEKVEVDVFFDATYSMQGYTTLAAGNVYRTLPDILDSIGSSMGKANFFRFGENVQPIEGRQYRNFSSTTPYTEIITAVHNVIDFTKPDHLSIIITDLFESEADWSNISNKISTKFFAEHKVAAVIGIKNSFNGDIFDVGLNAAKFNYNSADDPARYRPFYLLILGDEAPVKDFMERFKEVQTLPNETGYLLLSEHLTDTASDFSKMDFGDMENFFPEEKLNITEKGVKEFGLDKFTSPAMFTVNFEYKAPLGACPLDMSAMTQEVKILTLDEDKWIERGENDVKIEATPIEGEENHFTVKLSLTPEKSLGEGKINFISASFVPTAKGYQLPQWVKNWSMANVDVAPENFDGSKTVNLIHVLGALKDSVFATAHPALIDFNFAVDAR